jgi:hypothetical protein
LIDNPIDKNFAILVLEIRLGSRSGNSYLQLRFLKDGYDRTTILYEIDSIAVPGSIRYRLIFESLTQHEFVSDLVCLTQQRAAGRMDAAA